MPNAKRTPININEFKEDIQMIRVTERYQSDSETIRRLLHNGIKQWKHHHQQGEALLR